MEVKGIFPRGEKSVYLIANSPSDGGVFIYDIENNGLDEIRIFPGDKVIASEYINVNDLLLAFNNGVYLYKYNMNSLTSFVANISVLAMRFDELGNIVYIAENNKVCSYSYPDGSFINFVNVPDKIMNMHLRYNK